MTLGSIAFAAFTLALTPAQTTLPTHTEPLRNTFTVAAETVIDSASAIDLHADEAPFSAQLQQVKSSRENLTRMVEDDRERDIATATGDMIFAIQACHIQARDGASTTRCEAQIAQARSRAMEALSKHKNGAAWVDGPPTR